MKRLVIIFVLLALCWPETGYSGCVSCHIGIASPMPADKAHKLACTTCHGGNDVTRDADTAHNGMWPNPSALEHVEATCGKCHPKWAQRIKRSPMATAMGLINQTRYLWGAQPKPDPLFAASKVGGLDALPHPDQSGQDVDDLLRRRCLRCHLGVADDSQQRSAGCAACHRPMAQKGGKRSHNLRKAVPLAQCLQCHADCGSGAQYAGLVPRDAHRSARFDAKDPHKPTLWQSRTWRKMTPDAHYQAGMACIDCHVRSEIMGDGQIRQAGLLHVGLRCTSCHGMPGQPPSKARTSYGAPLRGLSIAKDGVWLRTKLSGKVLRVPLLKKGPDAPMAHIAPGHQRIACHACHNYANPAVWGLQLLRETRPKYEQWRDIAAQGAPQVWNLIKRQLELPPEKHTPPQSRDLISGEKRPGMWLMSPFFRRFEWRVYGLGPGGRTFLLSPRYQYVVTTMNKDGEPVRKAGLGLTPWHSHTVAKPTISCIGCHGNAEAVGLGLTFDAQPGKDGKHKLAPELWLPRSEGLNLDHGWTQVVNMQGKPLQALLVDGSKPYNEKELKMLLRPGKTYKRWLLRALEQHYPEPAQAQ